MIKKKSKPPPFPHPQSTRQYERLSRDQRAAQAFRAGRDPVPEDDQRSAGEQQPSVGRPETVRADRRGQGVQGPERRHQPGHGRQAAATGEDQGPGE